MQRRWPALFTILLLASVACDAASDLGGDEAANPRTTEPGLASGPARPLNQLTAEEARQGWQLLFDGKSFNGWHNYGAEPGARIRGWEIQDGSLAMVRDTSDLGLVWNIANPFGDGVLDLVSEKRYQDFELALEWKISPGGNSGIFYLVPDESAGLGWMGTFEMQVLDDDLHGDGELDKRRAGDMYDLKASNAKRLRPVGEWNAVRIRVEGDRIQHWMNQSLLLDVQRSGPEWEAMLAASKFADTEGFGQTRVGHILLQDHGDPVWYRNIRIRELPGAEASASPTTETEAAP